MKRSLLHVLLLLVVIFTLILPEHGCFGKRLKQRKRRRRRKYRRNARMFGLGNYLRKRLKRHERNQCSYRNCYITKQQNMLQTLMGDYIFKSIAMAAPMDITEAKYQRKQSHTERLINRFPAFIQGDIGRLRRRNLAVWEEQEAIMPLRTFTKGIEQHPSSLQGENNMMTKKPRKSKRRARKRSAESKAKAIVWISMLFAVIIAVMAWCHHIFHRNGKMTMKQPLQHTLLPV